MVVVEPGAIETEFGDVLGAGIAERSGSGPYKHIVDSYARMRDASGGNRRMQSSPPSVIAAVVSQAVGARKPKTRYVAGAFAKPLMFVRKWLGDKRYDKMVMGMVK